MHFKVTGFSLLIILLSFSSCSTGKKGKTTATNLNFRSARELIQSTKENNIAIRGFYIKNGVADITTKTFSGEFDFNAKINSKGDFSVSCRGPLKIELVRIYGINDSVYIIDRINKIIYEGSLNAIMKKYNVPVKFWEYLIGDVPDIDSKKSGLKIENDNLIIMSKKENRETKTYIDRNLLKTVESDYFYNSDSIIFKYKNHIKRNDYIYPEEIEINSDLLMFHVEIGIKNIDIPVNEAIKAKLPDYKLITL